MECNFCGYDKGTVLSRYTRLQRNNVIQCDNCGLVYQERSKTKQEVESYYLSQFWDSVIVSGEVAIYDSEIHTKFLTDNMDIKDKFVLEIGFGSGALLRRLQNCGCHVVGIELDKKYVANMKQVGLNVYDRPIDELDFNGEFDIVAMFHTLEHTYDPKATIMAINRVLKTGGYFFGEVPNQNDWRLAVFDDAVVKRFHYDSNHLFFFSPETLTNYLKLGGFSVESLSTVERYNSLVQLRNILTNWDDDELPNIIKKYASPKSRASENRLPPHNSVEQDFNEIFGEAVNSRLMGNCLRWVARKVY